MENLLRAAYRYSTVNYVDADYARRSSSRRGRFGGSVESERSFLEALCRAGVKARLYVANDGVHWFLAGRS